jgi:hypothetical protein
MVPVLTARVDTPIPAEKLEPDHHPPKVEASDVAIILRFRERQ